MVGWVGDPFDKVGLHLFADADFAGCTSTKRSTSGNHLQLRGPSTWFPLAGVSKRQACISHSTPEAELVAATFALRHCGLLALVLWDFLLSPFVGLSNRERGGGMLVPLEARAMTHQGVLVLLKARTAPLPPYMSEMPS